MHPALNLSRHPRARRAALLLASLCTGALLPAHAQLPTVTTRTEIWSGNGQPMDRNAQISQSQESPGQRALREQAQRNGTWVPAPPGLSDQERIWRDQQQMQREQWRQQREQTRQDDQRIRQESESPGQRALREQAQNRRDQGRMSTPR